MANRGLGLSHLQESRSTDPRNKDDDVLIDVVCKYMELIWMHLRLSDLGKN